MDQVDVETIRNIGCYAVEVCNGFRTLFSQDVPEDNMSEAIKQLLDLLEESDDNIVAGAAAVLASQGYHSFIVAWQEGTMVVETIKALLISLELVQEPKVRRTISQSLYNLHYTVFSYGGYSEQIRKSAQNLVFEALEREKDEVISNDLETINCDLDDLESELAVKEKQSG